VCHVRLTVRTLTFQTIRRHLQNPSYMCVWAECPRHLGSHVRVRRTLCFEPRKIHRKLRFEIVCCHSLERQIVLGPKTRTYQARHILQAENPKTPYRSGPRTQSTRRRRPTMPTRANQCQAASRTVRGPACALPGSGYPAKPTSRTCRKPTAHTRESRSVFRGFAAPLKLPAHCQSATMSLACCIGAS
jgi:hypothetical protein